MKLLAQNTLDAQNDTQIDLIEKIILYEQFDGRIKSVTESIIVGSQQRSQVVVEGDLTSFFSVDDYSLFPMFQFEVEYKILYISYDSIYDETTIQTEHFTSGEASINTYIAKKIDVTDKLTRAGIKNVKSNIEGQNLGEFDSGSLVVVASNDNGYFQSRDKSGILDSGNEFWVKYSIQIKGTTDLINYFGGLLDLTNMNPNIYDKTLELKMLGHSYELGRYPAFYLMDEESVILPRLGGIVLRGFTSSSTSEEGIKPLLYRPFTNSGMQGIVVEEVSRDTKAGIKVFEFRFPSFFRWDNGVWNDIIENPIHDPDNPDPDIPQSGQIKMYDYSGDNYAIVKVGDNSELSEFPDKDADVWVLVKDKQSKNFSKTVIDQGKPTLTFDNGIPLDLINQFQRILLNTGSYSEITQEVNDQNENIQILVNDDDEIIMVSSSRFYGIVFNLYIGFSSLDYTIHYSIGGELWSSDFSGDSDYSDTTYNLAVNGYIRWSNFNAWAKNNISPDDNTQYKGYMVKIIKTSSTGHCMINTMTRMMRAQGENGDFIEFDLQKESLEVDDTSGEVLIKLSADDTWTYGAWMNNVSVQSIFDKLTELSYYDSNKIESGDFIISRLERTFNIWGRPPRHSFHLEPTCFYIGTIHVYVAVGWEVWRATFVGTWEKVCDLYGQGLSDENIWKNYIMRMGVYDDVLYMLVSSNNFYDGSTIFEFSCDLSSGEITEMNTEDNVYTGLYQTREGRQYEDAPDDEVRQIGQAAVENAGESMCYPYDQQIWCDELTKEVDIKPAAGIEQGAGGGAEWYFEIAFGTSHGKLSGPSYRIDVGYYTSLNVGITSQEPDPYNIPVMCGQISSVRTQLDFGVNFLIFHQKIEPSGSKKYWVSVNAVNGVETNPRLMRSKLSDIPIASCSGSGWTYWSFSQLRDYDIDDYVAPSYISRAKASAKDFKKCVILDSGDSEVRDITSDVNAGNIVSDLFPALNYSLVFGHDKKLKTIRIKFTQNSGNLYNIHYSSGTDSWTRFDELLAPNRQQWMINDYFSVDMPDDWTENSVLGFAIKIELTYVTGTVDLQIAESLEQVIWDSALESSEDNRQQVVNMNWDSENDILMGCLFNRDDSGTNPFQWSLFTFNISTEIMDIIHSATNYIFEGTYLYKNFVFNSDDNVMYACAENIRYKDTSGFLIEMDWNSGTVLVNKLGTPRENDWGFVDELQYSNNRLFGITKGTDFILWEYSREYSPRVELVNYSESSTARAILKDICMMMNFYYMITSERLLRIIERGTSSTVINLKWDENMVTSKPLFPFWTHFYDAVRVNWKNIFTEKSGNKKVGYLGWKRKILPLSNNLVQNSHIAGVISQIQHEFYNEFLIEPSKIKTNLLFQLEILDGMTIYIPPKMADIDTTIEYVMMSIELTSTKQMIIKGLEIK